MASRPNPKKADTATARVKHRRPESEADGLPLSMDDRPAADADALKPSAAARVHRDASTRAAAELAVEAVDVAAESAPALARWEVAQLGAMTGTMTGASAGGGAGAAYGVAGVGAGAGGASVGAAGVLGTAGTSALGLGAGSTAAAPNTAPGGSLGGGSAAAGATAGSVTASATFLGGASTLTQIGGLAGGALVVSIAGGGGSTQGGGTGGPGTGGSGGGNAEPTEPGNPYPGSDPQTLDPDSASPADAHRVDAMRITLSGTTLPSPVLGRSLVVDLGARAGPLSARLYHTQANPDDPSDQVTRVMPYSGLAHVRGTGVDDMISGGGGDNELDAGGGADLVYGDGGADSMVGGAGHDWVLFTPLTRSGTPANPYAAGVRVDLAQGMFEYGPIRGQAREFENVFGTPAEDVLRGDTGGNQFSAGAGDDSVDAGSGDDIIYSGPSGLRGDQLRGGPGADAFWLGYTYNPVTRTLEYAPRDDGQPNLAVLHDWDAGQDVLQTAPATRLVLGGLAIGTDWDVPNTIDLRQGVTNRGVIALAAGAHTNELWLSPGVEEVWVGYEFRATSAGFVDAGQAPTLVPATRGGTALTPARDQIWGWDDSSATRDHLAIAPGAQAVIRSLQTPADWSGADTVDLRLQVDNQGEIWVDAGPGSNLVRGSAGTDRHFGSAGAGSFNQVWGGAGLDAFVVGNTWDGRSVVSSDLLWDWETIEALRVFPGSTAVIAGVGGLEWSQPNTLSLAGLQNDGRVVIALGDGDDILVGSAGVDWIVGGASAANGAGNQLRGGQGADRFFVGHDFDPVAGGLVFDAGLRLLQASQSAVDLIHDWAAGQDVLVVAARGRGVIGGLGGTWVGDWSGSDTVDVRAGVSNAGTVVTAAGSGQNTVIAGLGVDHIFVGHAYLKGPQGVIDGRVAPPSLGAGAADDLLWHWDDQGSPRDQLWVSERGVARIASLEGMDPVATRWQGDDLIDLRQQVNNLGLIHLAAGAGSNTLHGSAGSDHIHVGYQVDGHGATAASGAAVDTVHGWDARRAGTQWVDALDTGDLTYDRLTVAASSTLFIGSLAGMVAEDAARWDGGDRVDLRHHVDNLGTIVVWTGNGTDFVFGSGGIEHLYGGSGADHLYGGAGSDVFHVGYAPPQAASAVAAAESQVWDWQNSIDALRISPDSAATIRGLQGHDLRPQVSGTDRWAGSDVVDLRGAQVVNLGKAIVSTYAGDDTVYGSAGVDWVNAGAGDNRLDLGAGGADRVYIDSFLTRTQVSGFDTGDRLYLDQRLLEAFITGRQVNLPATHSITSATDARTGAALRAGQDYDDGRYALSETIFNSTFNSIIDSYGASPRDPDYASDVANGFLAYGWQSNGAWNNAVYDAAYKPNTYGAVVGAGTAMLATGNGLSAIPIVGPILAIPLWVLGSLTIVDGVVNQKPYLNAEYRIGGVGGVLDDGASLLAASRAPGSTDGAWDATRFLDFFDVALNSPGRYAPSLEVVGHHAQFTGGNQTLGVGGVNVGSIATMNNQLTGIASFLVLTNGSESFVYLVASQDSLIQNNEARLIAQLNGVVSAEQLVLFDGAVDPEYRRYFENAVELPVFPATPSIDLLTLTPNAGRQVLHEVQYTDGSQKVIRYVTTADYDANKAAYGPIQQTYTDSSNLAVTLRFDKDLMPPQDSLTFLVNGVAVQAASLTRIDAQTYTASFTAAADGFIGLQAVVVNTQEFESQGASSFVLDTTGPDPAQLRVADAGEALVVTSNEPGTAQVGTESRALDNLNARQVQFALSASGSPVLESIVFRDIFGRAVVLDKVFRGSAFSDVAILDNDVGFVFGFDGDDAIAAGQDGVSMYGGTGADTLVGGAGADRLSGGAGADTLNLLSGNTGGATDVVTWQLARGVSNASDSSAAAPDRVYGLDAVDRLLIAVSGSDQFDAATQVLPVSVETLLDGYLYGSGPTNETFTRLRVDVDRDGNSTGPADLEVLVHGTHSRQDLLAQMLFDVSGTDQADALAGGAGDDVLNGGKGGDALHGGVGKDQLNGGDGDDVLTGGGGADRMDGGAGRDTFVFVAGDSTRSDPDSIAGVDLGTDKDLLDLPGAVAVPTDTAGRADGADAGGIASHSVIAGLARFFDGDGKALVSGTLDPAKAVAYLDANLADAMVVGFLAGNDAYVFHQSGTQDTLVQLFASATLEGLTTQAGSTTPNHLFIA